MGGVGRWATREGDRRVGLSAFINAALLAVEVGTDSWETGALPVEGRWWVGGGGRGLCDHVAHPSVSRTRLMEGLSRSSMAGRPSPRGEWNSFLCSSRSLPS